MRNIIELLEEIHPEYDYAESENFIDGGYIDSFDLITLVAAIETEYSIKIKGTEIVPENFYNLDAIKALVAAHGVSDEI